MDKSTIRSQNRSSKSLSSIQLLRVKMRHATQGLRLRRLMKRRTEATRHGTVNWVPKSGNGRETRPMPMRRLRSLKHGCDGYNQPDLSAAISQVIVCIMASGLQDG